MSELRKANFHATFFVTLTVVGWIDVFTRKDYCEILVNSIKFCQEQKGLEVFAYVIMPSHIHMVARQKDGRLNEIIRDFKSFTSKQILNAIEKEVVESRREWMLHLFKYFAKYSKQNTTYMFWQKTNHPIELFTPEMIDQKIVYIHNNPVEANIVTEACFYHYSSASVFSPIETIHT